LVHEDNNIGWTVIGKSNFTTDLENTMAKLKFDNGKYSKTYPNPFVNSLTIEYIVPEASNVNLDIFDSQGRMVKSAVNIRKPAGDFKYEFDGQNLSPGIYFYRFKAGNVSEVNKFIKE
jgi:flagellar hook assembly protein FlgD